LSYGDFAGGLIGSDVETPKFDPWGLSADTDEATLGWYRAAELKHGRVCMLAVSSRRQLRLSYDIQALDCVVNMALMLIHAIPPLATPSSSVKALGLFVQAAYQLPDSTFSATKGLEALTKVATERPQAIAQILLAIGAVEVVSSCRKRKGLQGDGGGMLEGCDVSHVRQHQFRVVD